MIQSFDSRLNLFVGFILNGLLLWDFHCIRALEKWKRSSAEFLPGWLENIGLAEAYISLVNYSFNNPSFDWPTLSSDGAIIKSSALGHPLIDENKRICNDFTVAKQGRIVIITGQIWQAKVPF